MKSLCILSLWFFSALTVSPRLTPSTTSPTVEATGESQGAGVRVAQSLADAGGPTAAVTQTSTHHKPGQPLESFLTGTTVVIIVSVSLALPVCALIPLIFYGRWRSNQGPSRTDGDTGSTGEDVADCYDKWDNEQDRTSPKHAVGTQLRGTYVDPTPSVSVTAQHDALHRGLDPKTQDWNSEL